MRAPGQVKRLAPVWSLSLENEFGEQAQPLVYNGVVYVSNVKWTVAIDGLTGKQLWRTAVEFPPETPRVVCCGVSNKGVALYEGKVFRTTIDAYIERATLACAGGLDGTTIAVRGLSATVIDVLVRVLHADGSAQVAPVGGTYMATP